MAWKHFEWQPALIVIQRSSEPLSESCWRFHLLSLPVMCCVSGGAVLAVLQSSGPSRWPERTQWLPPVQGGNQTHVGGKKERQWLHPVCLTPVPPVSPWLLLSAGQDESNRSGGKWIIRLRKGLASRFWENIILAMLGEQFMVGEEICGAVVSIRFQVRPRTEAARAEIPHRSQFVAVRQESNPFKIFTGGLFMQWHCPCCVVMVLNWPSFKSSTCWCHWICCGQCDHQLVIWPEHSTVWLIVALLSL